MMRAKAKIIKDMKEVLKHQGKRVSVYEMWHEQAPALSTNVMLRYIVEDDPRQSRCSAVHRYRELNIDLADCLQLATARTFDV